MRIEFSLDCNDLDSQARFWVAALSCEVEGVIEGRYIALTGPGISLALQRVPEAKTVKNRMHPHLFVDDVSAEVGRLESLGATRITRAPHQEFGQAWYVMADPRATSSASLVTRRHSVSESATRGHRGITRPEPQP